MADPKNQRFRQYLSTINPLGLFAELVIVFLGVYLAFLFSAHQEERKIEADKEKIVELLEFGLERYHELFSGFATRHENLNPQILATLQNGEVPDFGGEYFVAPQYPIDAIKFLLTDESYDLFENGLYVPLIEYVNRINRLMYVEEKLVELSEVYEPLPATTHPSYEHLHAKQMHKGWRYYRYMELRKEISSNLADHIKAVQALLPSM